MCALSYLCPGMGGNHALDLSLAVQLNSCPTILLIAKTKTNVFEASRDSAPSQN